MKVRDPDDPRPAMAQTARLRDINYDPLGHGRQASRRPTIR